MYKVILILDKKFFLKYEGGGKRERGGGVKRTPPKKATFKKCSLIKVKLKASTLKERMRYPMSISKPKLLPNK